EYEDLVIDVGGHRVLRAGQEIGVTPKEFTLLEALARRPNRVFTRDVIASLLWPGSGDVDDNLLDAHVANLRQKLEGGGGRRLIQTVRGAGLFLRWDGHSAFRRA